MVAVQIPVGVLEMFVGCTCLRVAPLLLLAGATRLKGAAAPPPATLGAALPARGSPDGTRAASLPDATPPLPPPQPEPLQSVTARLPLLTLTEPSPFLSPLPTVAPVRAVNPRS